MKFTVELATLKKEGENATTGKKWAIYKLNLKDEQGVNLEADTFDNVMSGEIVEGEITESQYGKNFKKVSPKAVAGANFKAKQIEETMQRKETSIAKFQDSKEFSIMVTSSMNKAIELAIAEFQSNDKMSLSEKQEFYAQGGTNDLIGLIQKWRKWIIDNWSLDKTDTPAF